MRNARRDSTIHQNYPKYFSMGRAFPNETDTDAKKHKRDE